MPDVEVATCQYGASPDDDSGMTIRFVTAGAPSLITWRFGDATDEANERRVTDHTYSAPGTYEAIGVVGATGQRMVMTVGVPSDDVVEMPEPPDAPAPTLTALFPNTYGAINSPAAVQAQGTFDVQAVAYADGVAQESASAGVGLMTVMLVLPAAGEMSVTVRNPDGQESGALPFTAT